MGVRIIPESVAGLLRNTHRERMFSLIGTAKLQKISAYKWLRGIVEHHMLKENYQVPAFLA